MADILEIVLRVAFWSGVIAFTWSVSASLEKIANAQDAPKAAG